MPIRAALAILLASTIFPAENARAGLLSGRVVSAADARPVAGVEVLLGESTGLTDAAGRFRLEGEGVGTVPLVVKGEPAGFCEYRGPLAPCADDCQVALIPGGGLRSSRYSSFLSFFRSLTATGRPRELLAEDVTLLGLRGFHGTRLLRWSTLPLTWDWDHVDSAGTVERTAFLEAAAEWETATVIDLFRRVAAGERARLTVHFGGEGSWIRVMPPWSGGEPAGILVNLDPGGGPAELRARAAHELGHSLFLLGHSRDPSHVMFGGGVRGQRVSADEARAVRVMFGLSVGEDLENHRWSSDETLRSEEGSDRAVVLAAGFLMLMILFAMEAAH